MPNELIFKNKIFSLKEISEKIGVSQATVSYALSGKGNLSEKTRAEIIRLVGELGYEPNKTAQLLNYPTVRVLFLIPSTLNLCEERYLSGVEHFARSFKGTKLEITVRKYSVLGSWNIPEFELLGTGDYDCAVAMLDRETEELMYNLKTVQDIISSKNIPVVSLSYDFSELKTAGCVMVDAYRGGMIAADVLRIAGCTNAVPVSGSQSNELHSEYIRGFTDAARKYGMKVHRTYFSSDTDDTTIECAKNIIHDIGTSSIEAGIFITTYFSWDICDVLKECGKKYPVVGMDLFPKTKEYLRDGQLIATICQSQALQTEKALQLAIDALVKGVSQSAKKNITVQPTLTTLGSIED